VFKLNVTLKLLLGVVIVCMLLSLPSSSLADYPETAPTPTPTPDAIIWFSSDAHLGSNDPAMNDWEWNVSCWDFNNISQNQYPDVPFYAFAIGDVTESGFAIEYEHFYENFSTLQLNGGAKNYTYGNHDPNWELDSGNQPENPYGNWTYSIGNILILALSTERNWTDSNQGIYSHQTAWWNATVQANQDKNIISLIHHGMYNTTPATDRDNIAEGGGGCLHVNWSDDYPVFKYVLDNYKMNLWVHGHTHMALNAVFEGRRYIATNYNDTYEHYFMNDGGIADHSATVSSDQDIESVFMFLYNDNDTAIMCRRNHTQQCWYPTNQSITLDYPFRDGINDPPVISSPIPSNNTVGMGINLNNLSFTLTDSNGDTMNYTIEYNGISNTFDGVSNGSQTPILNYASINPLSFSTAYTWYVNATDGELWTNESFIFTTKGNTPPAQSNPYPIDTTTEIPLTPTNMSITVSDVDASNMNVYFYTNESGTWQLADQNLTVPNGTYTCVNTTWIDSYNTTYWWSVNVTDGTSWTNTTRSFTTKVTQAVTVRITGTVPVYNPSGATTSVISITGIFMLASAFMFIAIYIWNKNGGIL